MSVVFAKMAAGIAASLLVNGLTANAKLAVTSDQDVPACLTKAADGKPWLAATLWGLRDQEGGWVGAEQPNSNGTHDLGPLQVNSAWVPTVAARLGRPQAQVHQWLKNDACFNAGVAKWIFLTEYQRRHDYWSAVGSYHSPTPRRARGYAIKVAGKLQARFGASVYATPAILLAQAQPYQPPSNMQRRPSLPVVPGTVMDALKRHGQNANDAIKAEQRRENEAAEAQQKQGLGSERVDEPAPAGPQVRYYGIARATEAGSEASVSQAPEPRPATSSTGARQVTEITHADGTIDFSALRAITVSIRKDELMDDMDPLSLAIRFMVAMVILSPIIIGLILYHAAGAALSRDKLHEEIDKNDIISD